MRCFEAMGLRNLLLGDDGIYPDGMEDNKTLATYTSAANASEKIRQFLIDPTSLHRIAHAGYEMISRKYSKEIQWTQFQELAR